MPHIQFSLNQKESGELKNLPQIAEFILKKSSTIQLGSFEVTPSRHLQLYFVLEGKFDWLINQQQHLVYPGETVLVLPGQEIGGSDGYLGRGTYISLKLRCAPITPDGKIDLGKFSGIPRRESLAIGKILLNNQHPVLKVREVPGLLQEMRLEIMGQELGYLTRVHHMLDSLLIVLARRCNQYVQSERDFPQNLSSLEEKLNKNLEHQWTVEEMANSVGLGRTAFAEKVKSFTGFSPLLYLTNIRILKAIELLKSGQTNITKIALDTGFYSSQHFSTTFKKFTGFTPGEFRRKNLGTQ